jgi:carboxyl-terminal processing protease
MKISLTNLIIIGFVLLLWPLAGYAEEPPPLTPEQINLNLASFDTVWNKIYVTHYDTTFGGLNWHAVKDELRPKIEKATSMNQARSILSDLVSRLGLSHFDIIPSNLYENINTPAEKSNKGGVTGIILRVLEGKAIVVSLDSSGGGYDAGVRPGWEILKAGDIEIAPIIEPLLKEFEGKLNRDYYLAAAVAWRLGGAIGDSLKIIFLDGNNAQTEKYVGLKAPLGKKAVFGNIPPFYLKIKTDTLENNIGYFYFNCFFDPITLMPAFNSAMESFLNSPGIIIDIRRNPGGAGMLAIGMAGWLVSEKDLYLGTLITRNTELKFVLNPRAKTYTGPVAILVDGLSGSTSEIFAGGLQDIGRVRVFGTHTVGAALPALPELLPNGDGFLHAIANYISKGGEALEGRGVVPNQEVRLTRESLLEGRDLVVEAAVEWIKSNSKK